ncbi:TIGR00282 family metallophosphoesterase [bacterium]|nr:TIGR00282 family metallophosphoesterase [bacterium]
MRILFIGDVVGKPGRRAVTTLVPRLRRDRVVDLVIANGENSAHGAGLSASTVDALFAAGVDVITTGDHVWDQKGIDEVIELQPRLLRPLNMPPGNPGRGSVVVPVEDQGSVAVVNLVGRVYMPDSDCPFRAAEAEVGRLRRETPVIIVDLHAEATSEKVAMGRFLDGRVSAVIGTHTHIPTADEQLLPGGTAYLTDVGMCGPFDSVLGRDVEAVLRRFVTQMPQKMEVATRQVTLCAVLLEIDARTGRAQKIERLRISCDDEAGAVGA